MEGQEGILRGPSCLGHVRGVNYRVGTSGFAYKEWKGTFYPEDLAQKKYLTYYASKFGTVEINNTFYRMPKPELLQKWQSEVPGSFVFVLKAPQRITHHKKLLDVGDDVTYFTNAAKTLGAQLGPLLFQLPPWLRQDVGLLKTFLALVPAEFRVAMEFRHASWFTSETYDALREHNAALCSSDTDDAAESAPLVPTADFGYTRLRRTAYDEAALNAWHQRFSEQKWHNAYVFFKHEDSGTGPALGQQFLSLFAK